MQLLNCLFLCASLSNITAAEDPGDHDETQTPFLPQCSSISKSSCEPFHRTVLDVGPDMSVSEAIERARRMPHPVTLRFAEGLYRLEKPLVLTSADSGMVLEAASGADVCLSGGFRLEGWERNADGTWSTYVQPRAPFRQLTVNGMRAIRCQEPNDGTLLMAGETVAFDSSRSLHSAGPGRHPDMVYDPRDIDFAKLKDLTTGEIRVFHWWIDSHLKIGRVDDESNRIVFARPADFYVGYMHAGKRPCRYRAENFREFLDKPGEWFLDEHSGRIDYLPRPGEDPSSSSFEAVAAHLHELVRLEGGSALTQSRIENVVFRNLCFRDADAALPLGDVNSQQGAVTVPAAIVMSGVRDCRFEGCTFEALDGYAIDLLSGCRNNAVIGCDFHDLGGGAVRMNGGEVGAHPAELTRCNAVMDCEIRNYGLDWASSCAVLVRHAGENLIAHNWIHDGFYTAISLGWCWGYGDSVARGNIVEFNLVENIGKGLLNDMGGVYTLGLMPGAVIRNNIVRGIRRWSYGGHALYNDQGTQGLLVENNLFYDAPDVYNIHYGREIVVRNNIFACGGDFLFHGGVPEAHVTAYVYGNIFWLFVHDCGYSFAA